MLIFLDLCVTSHGIAVTIKCPDNSGKKELTKKLPGTMTVQKLKGLLQRLYKVDSSEQKLSYLDNRVSHCAISHCHFWDPCTFPWIPKIKIWTIVSGSVRTTLIVLSYLSIFSWGVDLDQLGVVSVKAQEMQLPCMTVPLCILWSCIVMHA